MGSHADSVTANQVPLSSKSDYFVIYRYLGHPELLFSSNPVAHNIANEHWIIDDDTSDKCYFCENHKFVQVFFQDSNSNNHYEQIVDKHLISHLK